MEVTYAHKLNVEAYLGLLRTLATDSEDARLLIGQVMRKERYRRRAWAVARQAHIVEITPSVWATIDHEADVYLAEAVAGGTWTPLPADLAELSPALAFTHGLLQSEHIAHRAHEAAEALAVPGPRPFDVLFLAFGSGVPLASRYVLMQKLLPEPLVHAIDRVAVTGILVAAEIGLEVQRVTYRPGVPVPAAFHTGVLAIFEDEVGWWLPELCHVWSLSRSEERRVGKEWR